MMNPEFYIVIWDRDIDLEHEDNIYEDYTTRTIDLLIEEGNGLNLSRNSVFNLGCFRNDIERMLRNVCRHLSTQILPPNIEILVCHKHEFINLCLYNKTPIVFVPRHAISIKEVEDWIIRTSLLYTYYSLERQMTRCIAMMNRHDGVSHMCEIEVMRKRVVDFFDDTQLMWGNLVPSDSQESSVRPINDGQAELFCV